MTTYFVTRHPGAVQWAADAGIQVADGGVVNSLDPERVMPGDRVVGTLPINLAARVVARGAEYLHLALDLPPEVRGKELSLDEMRQYGARLERYDIHLSGNAQIQENKTTGESVMLVIASGQIIPNLLPLLSLSDKPSHLYLVLSRYEDAKASAVNIKRVTDLLNIPVSVFSEAPAAPLDDVQIFARQCFDKIRLEKPDARIVLNATGGNKIMSFGFSTALGPAGTVIYCDTTNDRIEYFSPQGRKPLPLPPDVLDLDTYLLAQGQKIVARASDFPGWLKGTKTRQSFTRYLADALAQKNTYQPTQDIAAFNRAADSALRDKKGISHWQPLQTISNLRPQTLDKAISSGLLRNGSSNMSGKSREIEFTSKEGAQYLCGGWLEEYCALTMQALSVPATHWGCGVKIRPIDAPRDAENETDDPSLNELDLAVVWRNRLLIVECKTGRQLQNKDSQCILNKLEAIRNYAAGSFGTGWLLNVHLLDENSPALQRAKAYRITLHEREEIAALPQLIARWMGRELSHQDAEILKLMKSRCQQRKRKPNRKKLNSQGGSFAYNPVPANAAIA